MEQLLNEINSIFGVTGAYIFSRKHGIMSRQMPEIFKDQRLEKLGIQLNRSFSIAEKNKVGIDSFEIGFERIKILGYVIDSSTCFYVFCQPDSNLALIKMSLDVIRIDILEEVKNYKADPKPTSDAKPAPKAVAANITPDKLLVSSAMGTELNIMKHAFTLAVGPMAEIIMKKLMKKWIAAGQADKSHLSELADLLQSQIDDPIAVAEFREGVKSVL